MNESAEDVISYMVVVRGLAEVAYARFSKRFPGNRGGASPGPSPREIYQVVDCELGDVSDVLSWIVGTIPGQFRVVELRVNIQTVRNWANFEFPSEIVQAAERCGATLKVSFMSPARSWSPPTAPV